MPQWCDRHKQHTIDEVCDGCVMDEARGRWLPIDTAPLNRPVVLLEPPEYTGSTLYGHIVVGAWKADRRLTAGGYWLDHDGVHSVLATHWMPLPEPPDAP